MERFSKIIATILIGGMVFGALGSSSCESSVFCYGRLLHDVQVNDLFKTPLEFLELRARRPSHVISARYRDLRPKLKLSSPEGRQMLKSFISRNFVNRSSHEAAVPSDWKAQTQLLQRIRHSTTTEFYRTLNRKLVETCYDSTLEAKTATELHSTLIVQHPFFGSSGPFLNYYDSWWVYQGLVVSGMTHSARMMIENLAHLVDEFGYVPPLNRVYCLGRSAPPFLAIMLEAYLNLTGDANFATRYLPHAELDFHHFVRSSVKNVTAPFDVFLVVQLRNNFVSNPRPERYKEDWAKTPSLPEDPEVGLTVASTIWGSEPPRGNVSVRLVAITEWAARALVRLCNRLGATERRQVYSFISWELLHTMDNLLYSKKNGQWMDYSPQRGHVNKVSLWPVYTGARPWRSHYKVVETSNLEESIVTVHVLKEAGQYELAEELTSRSLRETVLRSALDLKESSLAILLLSWFPGVTIPDGAVVPPVHTKVFLIVVPMMFITALYLSVLFLNVKVTQ